MLETDNICFCRSCSSSFLEDLWSYILVCFLAQLAKQSRWVPLNQCIWDDQSGPIKVRIRAIRLAFRRPDPKVYISAVAKTRAS